MKSFATMLAVAALTNVAHAATDTTEFKWDAELRTRFFSNENIGRTTGNTQDTTPDTADAGFHVKRNNTHWAQRNVLGLTMTKGESLSGRVRLMNSMIMGTGTGANNQAQPQQADANQVYVQQAFGTWAINANTVAKFGRMGMITVADGTVMAENDWLNAPFAVDGVGVILDHDWGRVAAMGVKAAEGATVDSAGGTNLATDPETNFYGVSLDVKNLPDVLKIANIHLIQENKDQTGCNAGGTASGNGPVTTAGTLISACYGINMMRYGATIGGDTMNIDYNLTYAAHSGKLLNASVGGLTSWKNEIDWTGNMIDATLGYSMPEMMKFRVGVNYHMDSGQDSSTTSNTTYQPFYYDRHARAGRMDIVGWGNLTYIDAGIGFEPMEKSWVGLNYLMFSRTQTSTGSHAYAMSYGPTNGSNVLGCGGTTGCAGASNTEKDIGSEIDLWATHKYDNGLDLTLRYGAFTPGAFLKKNGSGTTIDAKSSQQIMLEGTMTF